MLSQEWVAAHRKLLTNLQNQNFVPQYDYLVNVKSERKVVYLPAYIPYVGSNYFQYKPRILCYAINQNLSKHRKWSNDWLSLWSTNHAIAHDRLNHAAKNGNALPIKPYAEGFIPLVALIAIRSWINKNGGLLPLAVDDVIAVTNFVKFSTKKDASSSSIPLFLWRECGKRYVEAEIRILKPDIILCFGLKTFSEIKRIIYCSNALDFLPEILKCRFPARIPSIKSKPLSSKDSILWYEQFLPLINKIRKPKKVSYHKWKIHRYPNYFIETAIDWNAF